MRAPNRALAGLLVIAWGAGSCTALREIPRSQYGEREERKDVRLKTREGLVYELDFVRVTGDTLLGYRRQDVEGPIEEYASLRVPLDDVAELEARSIDWRRTGLLGGAVAAAVVAVGIRARKDSGSTTSSGDNGKVP